MSPEQIFSLLFLWIVNLCVNSYNFCLYFILYLHVWIQICIQNTDPDPQRSWLWIWIRIHNTSSSYIVKLGTCSVGWIDFHLFTNIDMCKFLVQMPKIFVQTK